MVVKDRLEPCCQRSQTGTWDTIHKAQMFAMHAGFRGSQSAQKYIMVSASFYMVGECHLWRHEERSSSSQESLLFGSGDCSCWELEGVFACLMSGQWHVCAYMRRKGKAQRVAVEPFLLGASLPSRMFLLLCMEEQRRALHVPAPRSSSCERIEGRALFTV